MDVADLVHAVKKPWLRFALVGGLLFALDLATPPQAAPPPSAVALDEDALLVHEAFARGLGEQQPQLLGEPSEAELARYLAAHAERFTEPERVTLSQLYFRDAVRARAASRK